MFILDYPNYCYEFNYRYYLKGKSIMESQKAYLESKIVLNAIKNITEKNFKITVKHNEPIESIQYPATCYIDIETIGGIGKSSMSRIVKHPNAYSVEENIWELFDKMEKFQKK